MSTVQTLINDAFLDAQIFQSGEVPEAEDSVDALAALNKMLHAWAPDYGIDIGHSDVALTDTITLPDSHLQAVEFNLAIHLAAKYETQVPAAIVVFAARGLRALQAAYVNIPELNMPAALTNRTGSRSGSEKF